VIAAGGIVIRNTARPLVGIVQLRKDKSWVLPKGKLKPGEKPLAAARREVEEETGHEVTVFGFLGTLSQVSDNRHKIVQFWHMQASAAPVRPLMSDVKAVKWLPLRRAIETLSRPHERAFLSNVGPIALRAHARQTVPVEPVPASPPELATPPPEEATPIAVTVPAAVDVEVREPAPSGLGATIAGWLRRLTSFAS
jgi:8-oxo-dGTP diphosphatase